MLFEWSKLIPHYPISAWCEIKLFLFCNMSQISLWQSNTNQEWKWKSAVISVQSEKQEILHTRFPDLF